MTTLAQTPAAAPFSDPQTLRHFQALVRMNSTDPPGNERPVVDYVKGVLESFQYDIVESLAKAR